mgnify:CR=1 FL=1
MDTQGGLGPWLSPLENDSLSAQSKDERIKTDLKESTETYLKSQLKAI